MRIDYTLPALQPGTVLEAEQLEQSERLTFQERLRRSAPVQLPLSVDRVLGLDAVPQNAMALGPPPRPHTLETSDADSERSRWRSMLLSHSQTVRATGVSLDPHARQAVDTMLGLLVQTLRMEEAIASRSAAVTRG